MNLRKGDVVQVIAGDTRDHGKRGRILSVDWKMDRVLVEGVNLIKRHTKPSSNNQQGGRTRNRDSGSTRGRGGSGGGFGGGGRRGN